MSLIFTQISRPQLVVSLKVDLNEAQRQIVHYEQSLRELHHLMLTRQQQVHLGPETRGLYCTVFLFLLSTKFIHTYCTILLYNTYCIAHTAQHCTSTIQTIQYVRIYVY